MKNEIFVAEYNEGYTGGSVVFFGTFKKFQAAYPSLIVDKTYEALFNFYNQSLTPNLVPNQSEGKVSSQDKVISRQKIEELCVKFLQDDKAIKIVLDSAIPSHGYNRKLANGKYDTNCSDFLRIDWMLSSWKLPEGLYIVFVNTIKSKINGTISNSYYCA